jgi:membrane protease YdiL (CAAX protease family)
MSCLPAVIWPWYLFFPLAGYTCLALVVPALRRTMPPVRPGRVDRIGLPAAALLCAATAAVLLGYQALRRPDVSHLSANLPEVLFRSFLLGGLIFSLVNAVLEELMCRWVLYDAIAAEWGVAAAIVVTSVFFGAAHYQGYPPGVVGAVLAGAYGALLASLRWWSGGLALPIACHACADATIFWILCEN